MIRGIAEVTPSLYLSSSRYTQREVECKNISCIVNATKDFPSPRWHTQHVRVPVNDVAGADLSCHFDRVADTIESNSMAGKKTLVHCMAGVSRSASLCIAYLMKYHRMSLRSAHAHVKSRRPIIRPNPGFWEQLIDYEEHLTGCRSSVIMVDSPVGLIPDVYLNEVKDILYIY